MHPDGLVKTCPGRHEVLFKSVGGDYRRLYIEQLLTLLGRYVAYRSETVGGMGSGFFKRVLRLHVGSRHLVAVISLEIIV